MSSKQQRRLGPSRTGTTHFWHQRLTALALIPLTLFFVGLLPNLAGATHREFVTLMGEGASTTVELASDRFATAPHQSYTVLRAPASAPPQPAVVQPPVRST